MKIFILTAAVMLLICVTAGMATGAGFQANSLISEVSLKREGCFGPCPVYEVFLRSDGTATYIGKANVQRIGRYRGSIGKSEFLRIAQIVERQDFFSLKSKYFVSMTDLATVIIRAVRRGRTKKVENYGGAAPINLRVIEAQIDAVIEQVNWKKEDRRVRYH
ncbi:MAG: DUF6438 domain-containing protein [Pyrinomonadaceae bacterium]